MTRYEARLKGKPPGYAIKLDSDRGLVIYLADYRQSTFMTTDVPASAEYFERLIDAQEMARRVSHITGQKWVLTTVPADNAENVWLVEPDVLPSCREIYPVLPTYFNVSPIDRDQTIDAGTQLLQTLGVDLSDQEQCMAAMAAVQTFAEELDDDDADVAAASLCFPAARPRVVAPEECP